MARHPEKPDAILVVDDHPLCAAAIGQAIAELDRDELAVLVVDVLVVDDTFEAMLAGPLGVARRNAVDERHLEGLVLLLLGQPIRLVEERL